MKRLVALALVLVFVFCGTAFAEGLIVMEEEVPTVVGGIDVTALSDDDLIALKDAVIQEISNRNLAIKGTFGNGTYVVGVDIKPGSYVISNTSDELGNYYIYESVEKMQNNEIMGSGYMTENGDATFNLHDGEVLRISGIKSATIEEIVASWAP